MSDPKANNVLVETLGSSLRYGGSALSDVPDLLKRVLKEKAWREFVTRRGEHVQHERFSDFVAAAPLAGLGADIDLVRRVVNDDREALDLLDQELQNPAHVHPDVDTVHVRPDGNSQARALRKLRKDAPELHSEVLEGTISANAAMVQAGFRHPTQSVRIDDPASAARTLRTHMSPDDLATLARLLMDEEV